MSEELKPCPKCESPYGYFMSEEKYVCPECDHNWNPNEELNNTSDQVIDANGNVLKDGDTVIVVKDLPVKGAPKPLKSGTKVKNIRLTTGDHNIDCKITGFGSMALKSEFVKKG